MIIEKRHAHMSHYMILSYIEFTYSNSTLKIYIKSMHGEYTLESKHNEHLIVDRQIWDLLIYGDGIGFDR